MLVSYRFGCRWYRFGWRFGVAVAGLERAYRERGEWLLLLKVDPRFDDLRTHPRLIDLAQRLNLLN